MERLVAVCGLALAFAFAGIAVGANIGSDTKVVSTTDGHVHDQTEALVANQRAKAAADGTTDGTNIADLGLGMLQNGHHEHMVLHELDAATKKKLDAQLAVTREVARKYPTLERAVEAGFRRAGPYSPGLGIHYINYGNIGPGLNPDGLMDREALLNPMSLIFDGTGPNAKIAGFMYYSSSEDRPAGFAGPNDFWHYHTNVCIVNSKDGIDAPFGADRSSTAAQCNSVGGTQMAKTQWMVHVWTVPGYEVTDADGGVFAEVNPKLKCGDGTYFIMDDAQWVDHPYNVCKSEL
jgi:hypothetical protein